MKTLIKPLIVASFLMMIAGCLPGARAEELFVGAGTLIAALIAGVKVLGDEVNARDTWIQTANANYARMASDYHKQMSKMAELENRISKALSENRTLAGQLRG